MLRCNFGVHDELHLENNETCSGREKESTQEWLCLPALPPLPGGGEGREWEVKNAANFKVRRGGEDGSQRLKCTQASNRAAEAIGTRTGKKRRTLDVLYTKPAFHILFSLFYERRAVKCDSFHCCNGFGLSILGFLTCPLSSRRHRRNIDSSFPRHKNHSHRTQTYTTHTTALQSSHVSHFHPLPYFHALIFVFFGVRFV